MGIKSSASITLADISDGTEGTGIASTAVEYQAGSSGTVVPTGEWTTDIPATSASAPYLWTRVTYTYTDDKDPEYFYSIGSTPEGAIESANTYTDGKVETVQATADSAYSRVTNRYGLCYSAASTVSKTVTLSGFTLYKGASIDVKFSYTNTSTSPTLNVNNTGAKKIVYLQDDGSLAGLSSASPYNWKANELVTFMYDGTYWRISESGSYRRAEEAAKTATNYLKFDSDGLCVGNQTGDTLGKNILIDSDSIDIRNGDTILASFSENTIDLGLLAEDSIINLCGGAGSITYGNYSPSIGNSISGDPVLGIGSEYGIDIGGTGSNVIGSTAIVDNTVTYTSRVHTSANNSDPYVNLISGRSGGGSTIYNRVYVRPEYTEFKLPIQIGGIEYTGSNNVLWSGKYVMNASHTCTFSSAVSEQPNGIVLVFREYASGTLGLHVSFFIAKSTIALSPGYAHIFTMCNSNLSTFATKYLTINDTTITGHANNALSTTAGSVGITYNNSGFILQKVIGV